MSECNSIKSVNISGLGNQTKMKSMKSKTVLILKFKKKIMSKKANTLLL